MRQSLYDTLTAEDVKGSWSHIIKQQGMFSFTGIPGPVVQRLKTEFHIYMLVDGRISLAGLNQSNISTFVIALGIILGKNNEDDSMKKKMKI